MTSLTAAEIQALHDALDDEYHAAAVYTQVLSDFGPVRPFLNIRDSELRHIQALHSLFRHHNLPIPSNRWETATLPRFTSLREACEAGVQGEIENIALYRGLLASTERHDLLTVFHRLQAASQERHLPAFQRAAARQGSSGVATAIHGESPAGCGAGRRHRHGRHGSPG